MLRRRFVGASIFLVGSPLFYKSLADAAEVVADLPECPSNFARIESCSYKFSDLFYDVYVGASILYADDDLRRDGKIDGSEWTGFTFNKFTAPGGEENFRFMAGDTYLLARVAEFYNGKTGDRTDYSNLSYILYLNDIQISERIEIVDAETLETSDPEAFRSAVRGFSLSRNYRTEFFYNDQVCLVLGGEFSGFSDAMNAAELGYESSRAAKRDGLCKSISAGDQRPCILTTVSCRSIGLPDDCFELRMMRRLRDRYVSKSPEGQGVIEAYYATAAFLLERTNLSQDEFYLTNLYFRYILPASALIWLRCERVAYPLLLKMVREIERRYLPPAIQLFQPHRLSNIG